MRKVIVHKTETGIAITYPMKYPEDFKDQSSYEAYIKKLIVMDKIENVLGIINQDALPKTRDLRDAWDFDGKAIFLDQEKCNLINAKRLKLLGS